MTLLENPGQALTAIGIATVVITALLAAMEASQLGMTSDRKEGTYSPVAWFFIMVLLWVVGYPAYLYKRRKYGLTNFLFIGLLVAAVFIASQLMLVMSIEQQKSKVRDLLGLTKSGANSEQVADIQKRNIESALDLYRLNTGRYPSTSEGLNVLVERPPDKEHWNGPYLDESTAQAIHKFSYENARNGPAVTPK